MQNLTLRWFLRGESGDGGGGASICWVGLIVKNGSLLLVFGLGNNLGIKGYLLWDLIGQLAWVKRQWKTLTWDKRQDTRHGHRRGREHRKAGTGHHITHRRTNTCWSSLARCLSVGVLICRLWPVCHTSEYLCEELWDVDTDTCFWSFQVHHIKRFAGSNLQLRSCQPCRRKFFKKSAVYRDVFFPHFFSFLVFNPSPKNSFTSST